MAGDVARLTGDLAGVVAAVAVDAMLAGAFRGGVAAGAVRPTGATGVILAVGSGRRCALVVRRAGGEAGGAARVAHEVTARGGRRRRAAPRAVTARSHRGHPVHAAGRPAHDRVTGITAGVRRGGARAAAGAAAGAGAARTARLARRDLHAGTRRRTDVAGSAFLGASLVAADVVDAMLGGAFGDLRAGRAVGLRSAGSRAATTAAAAAATGRRATAAAAGCPAAATAAGRAAAAATGRRAAAGAAGAAGCRAAAAAAGCRAAAPAAGRAAAGCTVAATAARCVAAGAAGCRAPAAAAAAVASRGLAAAVTGLRFGQRVARVDRCVVGLAADRGVGQAAVTGVILRAADEAARTTKVGRSTGERPVLDLGGVTARNPDRQGEEGDPASGPRPTQQRRHGPLRSRL